MDTPTPATQTELSSYRFDGETGSHAHAYLLPTIERFLRSRNWPSNRLFDLGCGNGSVAHRLSQCGFQVAGADPSSSGIEFANANYPNLDLRQGSAYDPLHEVFGTFPIVISLEVVEHVYFPRAFAQCVHSLLEPGGVAIISTPYHGYMKNLALAISNRMDSHFTALWDHGHIKFWSIKTLTSLFQEAGLQVEWVKRVGRFPPLAKSMVLCAARPE